MKVHFYIIYSLLLLCFSVSLRAQEMQNLTLADGLSGMSVTDINETDDGLVWIATSNGVSLYNGYRLVRYPFPVDWTDNYCYQIVSGEDGDLYAATSHGVLRLRLYEDDFQPFATDIQSAECVLSLDGKLYVGNRLGLFVVDRDGKSRKISFNAVDANNSVRSLQRGSDGTVWFSTRTALNVYNPTSGKLVRHSLYTESGLSRFCFAGGKVYVGTKNNGLFVMSEKGGKAIHIEGLGNVITNVKATADGKSVCVASDGGGAYTLDVASGQVKERFNMEQAEDRHLPTNAVYTYMKDKRGVNWFGMYRYGLSHSFFSYPLFQTYGLGTFSSHGLNVMSYFNTPRFMIIAKQNGFYLVDKQAKTTRYFNTSAMQSSLIRCVGYMNGDFYLGTYDAGLLRCNPVSGMLDRLPGVPQLEYASVSGITSDPKGNLWLSTSEGLYRITPQGDIRNYTEKNSPLLMGVRNMMFDSNGNGWIGTANGVCLYIASSGIIKNSEFPDGFFNKESVQFSYSKDRMYAFAHRHVYYTDFTMSHFGELHLPEGLVEEGCFDFAKDSFGNYWFVSEKGLFSYNERTGNVRHFGSEVGMTGRIVGAMSIDADGVLWLGTDDGLKYVNTKLVEKFRYNKLSRVVLDEIAIDGKSLSRGESLQAFQTKTMSIGWNLWSERFTAKPVMMDYSGGQNNLMEYSTDNGESWKRVGDDGVFRLAYKMPGKHNILFRLAGTPSTQSEYHIAVYPTFMAWMELLILLVAIALFIWWRRYHIRTNLLLNEHKETEKALIEENARMKANEEKYAKIRMSGEDLSELAHKMETYLMEEKPYLNKELKMSDIAVALKVSPSILSQLFTLYLHQNYYDYINAYRLKEFKRRIGEGEHKRLTIRAISEECGFKRTSFFGTFRKMEGMTPTEYIRKLQK